MMTTSNSIHSPLTELFKGVSGTVLVYGHTSSGKTYTMEGPRDLSLSAADRFRLRGLIPRALEAIFTEIQQAKM